MQEFVFVDKVIPFMNRTEIRIESTKRVPGAMYLLWPARCLLFHFAGARLSCVTLQFTFALHWTSRYSRVVISIRRYNYEQKNALAQEQ